jgi:hypothetical protein
MLHPDSALAYFGECLHSIQGNNHVLALSISHWVYGPAKEQTLGHRLGVYCEHLWPFLLKMTLVAILP